MSLIWNPCHSSAVLPFAFFSKATANGLTESRFSSLVVSAKTTRYLGASKGSRTLSCIGLKPIASANFAILAFVPTPRRVCGVTTVTSDGFRFLSIGYISACQFTQDCYYPGQCSCQEPTFLKNVQTFMLGYFPKFPLSNLYTTSVRWVGICRSPVWFYYDRTFFPVHRLTLTNYLSI